MPFSLSTTRSPVEGSPRRNYAAALLTRYPRLVLSTLVGLWLTPFALSYLPGERYAIYLIASDVVHWFSFLNLGFPASLRVESAQLAGKYNPLRLNQVFNTAFFAQLVVSAALFAVGVAASPLYASALRLEGPLAREGTATVVLMLLSFCLSLAGGSFSAVLFAFQKVHIDNLLALLLLLLQTSLVVVFLTRGMGLLSLPLAAIVATAVTTVLAGWRVFRLLRDLRLSPRYFSMDSLRHLWSLGIWFSVGAVATILIRQLDRVVVLQTTALAAVTVFVLTNRVYGLVSAPLSDLTETARPMLGQFAGAGDWDRLRGAFSRIFVLSNGVTIAVAAAIWAGNGAFVSRWVGPQYYGGTWLDTALMLIIVTQGWTRPHRALLVASRVVRPVSLCQLAEGGVNLLFSVALGIVLGLPGVALGTVLASLVTSCWYFPLRSGRLLGLAWHRAALGELRRIAPICAGLAFVAIPLRLLGNSVGGFPGAGLAAVPTLLVGCGLLWFAGFDSALKKSVFDAFAGVVQRARSWHRLAPGSVRE